MKTAIVTVLVMFAIGTLGHPYEVIEDDLGQEYYLVPAETVQRVRRGVDVSGGPNGGRVTLSHGGNIVNNDRHRLDGSAFASKPIHPTGPLTLGGQLDYAHKPSGAGASLGVQSTRHFGTDVSANGRVNLYNANHGRTNLDAYGGYNRHFGGPGGTGRPNYGGGLQFSHRF